MWNMNKFSMNRIILKRTTCFWKAIRIPCKYGWCKDVVAWYNANMGKIRLLFDDGSEDYLAPEEIDGVEIICV